jgi:Ca2+:H+ antiporter
MKQLWPVLCVILAVGIEVFHGPSIVVFVISILSIFLLVGVLGVATEKLAGKLGQTVGGLLNASLSNLPELIIGTVALVNGYSTVAKASITGSILANLLLGLGLAIVVGDIRHGNLRFESAHLRSSSSMLMLCSFCFIVPAVFNLGTPDGTRDLSLEMSLVLLAVYFVNVFGTIFSKRKEGHGLEDGEIRDEHPGESIGQVTMVMLVAAIGLGFASETMANALEPTSDLLGLSETFSGLIFLGAVGSLGEIISGTRFARKGQSGLLLASTMGTTIQIVLVVAPLLVIIGRLIGQPMDLAFTSFEVVSIVLASVITRELVQDGKANWFEGVLLIATYIIIAIGYFHLPD